MTRAAVKLWDSTIGAVEISDTNGIATFQYDPDFVRSGIELSPLMMPLALNPYTFANLSRETFHGLPGMLADCLPDQFGNLLINNWLARQGRTADSFNAVERLCYTGARGIGALEFVPVLGPKVARAETVDVELMVKLASEILATRSGFTADRSAKFRTKALTSILQIGTSAGGARAKAVIAWNPETNEVRSGQISADDGFSCWLLKFDGVSENRDKELNDPQGFGATEYAYSCMAKAAGITMSECRLLEEGGRRHFMTRRFDRSANGDKLHMQSLGALAHFDFKVAGAHGYEQALLVCRQLDVGMAAIEEQFRRMAFNVVARNQDDHVKNIAFLMDRNGEWSLSPFYDATYSYNPAGLWTSQHQMSLAGKRDNFTIEDFRMCAKSSSMKRGRAETILSEVVAAVSQWITYAEEAGIAESWAAEIGSHHRLSFPVS
jgi:serine/threonine-protein kinase HipA